MKDQARIVASPDVASRIVDGEAVLLDLASGKYFGLSAVGARMWQIVQSETTFGFLVETLLVEFTVGEQELRRDLGDLVGQLAAKKLISVR